MNWNFRGKFCWDLEREWRPESSGCPPGFSLCLSDFRRYLRSCELLFIRPFLPLVSCSIRVFLWCLFGLDDALSSDVQSHQVIRINFTRASRTGQISLLGKNSFLLEFLWFTELQFKLRDDLLGVAFLLHRESLCKVWEPAVLFLASSVIFQIWEGLCSCVGLQFVLTLFVVCYWVEQGQLFASPAAVLSALDA
jgi:hypothetical protein